MFGEMTRAKVIQMWFATVTLAIAAGLAFGASASAGTIALLLTLCLAPPGIVYILWPGVRPQTIAEVLHDTEARP
jgi:hypothetical protein